MDYEREPDSDMAGAPTESEMEPNAEAQAAESDSQTATTEGMPEPPSALDAGDDSDAPIQLDDAQLAADLPAATPALAQHLTGENVNLSQGGVQSIKATSVTLSQGGAGQVRAEEMTVQQGGVGMARAGNLTLQSGSSAFAVVADEATVEEGASTFLVVSRSFRGDVRPTIDWRTGLAFGAGLGLVLSILRRLR